ncbi:MAG TPA: PTS sugar transporter subunit IIA, partial [Kiritimatiellia bacterium]
GLSKKGVKFGAPANKLTRILFFVAIPTACSAFYLKLLAGLTQAFRNEEARESLFEAGSQEALWKALVKATRATIP